MSALSTSSRDERPTALRDRPARPFPAPALIAVVLVGLGALAAVWPVLLTLGGAPVPPAALLAHTAGMIAGYGAILQLLLMARWPLLERSVGADRLTRWHSRLGPAVLLAVLIHAVAAVAAWTQLRGLTLPAAAAEVLAMPYLVAATVATLLMIIIAAASIGIARRKLRFETWHGVHLLGYLAVTLAFLHAIAGPDFAGHRLLQIGWSLLYASTFVLVIKHRLLAPVQAATRHRLRVASLQEEAPGVVSIVVEGQHLDELRADAGQFFRWRFLTPDTWFSAHPFSLSAAPTNDSLRLTVKTLGDGSSILQSIPVGTWVVPEGPYGAMTRSRQTRPEAVLIAGGVGITPMRALFETLPAGPDHDLLLLYRTAPDAVVFRDELDELAHRRGARVLYLHDPDAFSPAELATLVPDLHARDIYFCGPPTLSIVLRRTLTRLGVPRRQFHDERFSF